MKLVLDGVPISQIRMKFSGRNGIGRVYDPREKQKRHLKEIIRNKFADHPLFVHPRISFIFHMPIPSSTPRRLLPLFNSGLLKHEKKPDVDNFCKLYLDCMDNIMFDGDQKVQLGSCIKLYHPIPKTLVIISEASSCLTPEEVDHSIACDLFGKQSDKCCCVETDFPLDSCNRDYLKYELSDEMKALHQIADTLHPVALVQEH